MSGVRAVSGACHHETPVRAIVVLVLVGWSARALGIEKHPDLLEGEKGCERWLGGSSGNDPSVRLNLVLCREGPRVRGRVQWSSLLSGWNVREVIGAEEGDGVVMKDVRILEERPEPGWRFCVVDRWALRGDGRRMEGTYDSQACNDHATVWFERMIEPDAGAGPSATPTPNPNPNPNPSPGPKPNPSPSPSPTPEPGADRCRCGGGTAGGWGALAVLLVLATRSSGARRSAGRSRRGRPRRWRRSRS